MTQSEPMTPPPAILAGQILAAMQRGSLGELESGLARAEALATAEPAAGADERSELLAAIAGQMRASMARFSRNLTPRLEAGGVCVRLLRHLADPRLAA